MGTLLARGAESPAQQGKEKKASPAEQAAQQEVKAREAEVLREAYLFLAGAGPDDAGHRAKAMRQVHQAVEILDKRILKNGTQGQKVVALQEGSAAARAKVVAEHSAKVHEPQALSDLRVREAGALLADLRGALEKDKQGKVLRHVDEALKQIDLALKVR